MKKHTNKATATLPATLRKARQISVLTGSIAAFVAQSAFANPAGEAVVHGEADFSRAGKTLTVKASDHSIIHWEDFSIGRGETTRFIQPGKHSVSLNRVVSGTPSELLGRLHANGNLILINPNGVLVGEGARVNVGGFTASTLDVSDDEFLRGADLTFSGDSAASVVNRGTIKAVGGDVFLFGQNVENSGKISAEKGTVGLAAGSEILLKQSGDERISVRPKGTGSVVNKGIVEAVRAELKAHGNAYALAINNEGVVRATGAVKRGGRVMLTAGGSGVIQNSGKLSARNVGAGGGLVKVDAGANGRVLSSGQISAVGGRGAKGGVVQILGGEVALTGNAVVDVSGDVGGGTVLVGGDYQGQNVNVLNAKKVFVGEGATIKADALTSGAGGKVILWSDELTKFAGAISAKGGALGGAGGFVETSSHLVLQATGLVDTSAVHGAGGTWLIDPNNIRIGTGGDFAITSGAGFFDSNNDNAFLSVASLQGALNAGGSVVITTKAAGTNAQAGDIEIWDTVTKTSGADSTLTLNAHRSVTFINDGDTDAPALLSTTNKLNIQVNTNYDADSSGGGFYMNYDSGLSIGATINTNGGNFTTNTAVGPTDKGVYIDHGTITTGVGNISITGTGKSTTTATPSIGIDITGNSSLTTTSGNITLVGTGGTSSTASTMGVSLYSGSTISTATGAIAITGTTTSTGANAYGVKVQLNSAVTSSGNGTIAITGTGSATATGSASEGIALFDNADVNSAGSGSITLTGTGGTSAHGIITGSTANDMTIGGGSATGALNLIANSISIDTSNTTIQTTGTATLRQNTNGTAIDLGSASGVTSSLNLSDAELDRITAGTVQIGDSNSGAITVSAALTHANNLSVTTGEGITFSQAVTMAVNKNFTASALGTTTGTISFANTNAYLATSGTGTISLTTVRDISLTSGASIITANGALTLSANAGLTGSGTFDAIDVNAGTVQVTGSGNLTLTGKGGLGGGADPTGVVVRNAGVVSGGTSGTVSVTGTGGTGTSNGAGTSNLLGVSIEGTSSIITSTGANVQVTGIGGTSSSTAAGGVLLIGGAQISAGGTGSVVVTGTGGTGTDFNYGVDLVNGSTITSANGTVQVTGTGGTATGGTNNNNWGVFAQLGGKITAGGTNSVTVSGTGGSGSGGGNHGVVVRLVSGTNGLITSGGGNVTVTGTAGTGGSGNIGIQTLAGGSITTATSGGNVTLIADKIDLQNTVSTNSSSTVTLRQKTNGVAINLGSAVDTTTSTLELSNTELGFVSGGTILVGDSNSGAITVSAAISHTNTNALTLTAGTGQNINLNADFTTAGGAVTFSNAALLGANVAVDTTNAGGVAVGAGITFSGTANGAFSLTENAGTAGNALFSAAVGGTTALTSLTLTNANNFNATAIGLTGAISITQLGTTSSITGIVSGTTFTKAGTGTVALSTANTYTGGTTINVGVLSTSSVTGLGTGAVSIAAAGSLMLNSAVANSTYVINGISGSGTINVANLLTGTNSVLISPSSGNLNSFTGIMNLGVGAAAGGGKFAMTAASQMPAAGATVNVLSNATLYVTSAITLASSVTLAGGDTGESLGQLRIDSGALVSGGVTIAGNITGTGDFLFGSNAGTGTISGVISESGGTRNVSKGGAGVIAFSNVANAYAGTTTIGAGSLNVAVLANGGVASSIGTSSNVAANLVLNGGTLQYGGTSVASTDRLFTLGATGGVDNSAASATNTLTFTNTGSIAFVTANAAATLTLTGSNTGTQSFAPTIPNNGTGIVGLTKASTSVWTLNNAANTYTGVTTINGGTLNVGTLAAGGTASPMGASTSAAANLVFGGGILRYTGSGASTDRLLSLNTGGGTITNDGTGALTFSNAGSVAFTTANAAFTLTLSGTNTASSIFTPILPNNGIGLTALTKTAAGTWQLTGANTYTGITTISQGVLETTTLTNGGTASGIGASTSAAASLVFANGTNAGTLRYVGTVNASTDRLFNLTNTTGLATIENNSAANTLTFSNTGTLAYGTTGTSRSFALGGTNTGDSVFTPVIADNGTGLNGFSKSGLGTWVVPTANTFSGAAAVNAGVLKISSATALGNATGNTSIVANAALYISGGINFAEPFSIAGGGTPANTGAIRSTTGLNTLSGLITLTATARINADANTLTLDVASGSAVTSTNITFVAGGAGSIVINDPLTLGSGGLTRDGVGGSTTVSSGVANVYTGGTTVTAGTLNYNGTLAAGGALIVGNTAATAAVLNIASSGTISVTTVAVGTNATAAGAIYQTAGTLTVTAVAGQTNFQLGAVANGYGYYSLSGGILNVNEVGIGGGIGAGTVGVMEVTNAGVLNDAGWLTVSRGSGTSSGVLNVLNGGTINLTGSVASSKIGALYGTTAGAQAIINISGAGSTITGPANTTYTLDLAASGDIAGTLSEVNLNTGGTLSIGGVAGTKFNPTASVNFSGGTLKPTVANAAFLTATGVDSVFSYGSGANINNNGVATTISRPILTAAGSGVNTAPTITSAGTGYVGAPMVTISGGGGTGAAAYATINPATGLVTGIVVTNPGSGYTSAPTFTLSGGTAGTAAVITGAAVTANTDGVVNYGGTSAGAVTVSGANTYTGITNINAGTVLAGINGAFGATSGKTVIASGATLNVNGGFTFGAEAFEVSGTGVGGNGAIINSGANALSAFQSIKLLGDTTFGGVAVGRFDIRGGIATLDLAGFTLTKNGPNDMGIVGAAGTGVITDGNIIVNAGRLWSEGTTVGSTGTGNITVNSGGTFGFYNQTGAFTRPIVLNTGSTLSDIGGTSSTVASTIAATGAVTFVSTGALTLGGVISGTTDITKTGAGTFTLGGVNTYSGITTISAGTLSISADSSLGTAPGTATPGSLVINNGTLATTGSFTLNANRGILLGAPAGSATGTISTGAGTIVYNGILADNGTGADSLTKAGAGQLTLGGVNTYTGTTSITGGILSIAAENNLGIAPITPTANLIFSGGGTLETTGSFTLNTNRSITTGTGGGLLSTAPGVSTAYAGSITGTGAFSKIGTGTLTYTGVASIPSFFPRFGTTIVDAGGNVTSTSFTSIGVQTGDNATLTVQNGGLYTSNGDFNVSDLTGSNGILNISGAGTVVTAVTLFVGKGGNSTGTINQTGGLLTSAGTPGDWRIGGPAVADGASVGIYNLSGGTLTANTNLQIGTYGTGSLVQTGGIASVSGYLSIGRYAGSTGTLNLSTGNGTFTANTQPLFLVGESGTGTLLVGGTSTLNAQTLTLGHTAGSAGTVTQSGGTINATTGVRYGLGNLAGISSGTFNLNGGTLATTGIAVGNTGTITSNLNLNGGTLKATAANAAFLTGLTAATVKAGGLIVDTNTFDITIGQALLHDAALGGTADGGFTKANAGALTLSGASTFTGPTMLNAGTTLVTGSLTGAGAIAVNSTATLGGTGSLAGTVTVNTGGNITGGTDGTVGTLTVGSLVFNGGTYKADLIGTAADKISTLGTVNLNGGTASIFALNNLASGVAAGTVFTFLENVTNSPLTGAAEGGTVTVDGQTASYTYFGALGGDDFTLTLNGSATLTGTAGADNFEVRRITSGGTDLIQVLRGGVIVDSRATAGYAGASLAITGGDGNDNLFINYSASGGIYDFDINYDGGNQTSTPGDSITIGGATVGTVTHNFIDDHSGSIVVNNGTARTINYVGIEPITDNLSATNRVFTFTGGAETIAITDAGGGLNMIDSTLGESVTFTSPTTSLIVNGGTGNDTINLTSLNASFAAALTINGDAGTNSVSIAAGLPTFASITVNAEAITANTLTTTGAQLYNGPVTLGANTTLTTTNSNVGFTSTVNGTANLAISTGTGSISFGSTVGSTTPLTSLATTSTGIATLTGNVTTTGASGVVLNSPVTLAATTTVSAATGPITFGSTLNGAFALALNSTGATTFSGAVGGTTALTSLTTNAGGTLSIGGNVTTTGAQSYGEAATIAAATLTTTNSAIIFAGGATLTGGVTLSTGSGNATFSSTIDGGQTLTINSTGATTFGGAVGGTTALTSLTTNAGGTVALNGGSITTTGAQTFGEAATLGAATTLAGSSVTFGNTLNGAFALTINSAGATTFSSAVGGTTALTSLTTDAGGSLSIGGSVTTSGAQSYGEAASVAAATLTTTNSAISFTSGVTLTGGVTLSAGSGNATFSSTLDGAQTLTINSTGATTFGGAIGGTTALTSLTTNAGGTVALNGGSITTTGAQTFGEAATLGAATTLAGSSVTFGNTLNGAFALTINSAGATTFSSAVGGTTALTSLTTDAGGSVLLNGGSITTTGAQTFGEAATLGAATTLAGGSVTFGNTLNGAQTLTINSTGATTFTSAIGGTTALTSLTTDAGGTLSIGGNVTTTGVQSYGEAATVAAATLTTTNNAITFGGAVTLAGGVTLSTGSGNATFSSTIDGGQTMTINSIGATTLGGVVGGTTALTSLTTNAGGTLSIGGNVTTTGVQSYGESATIAAATLTTANSAITFGGAVTLTGGVTLNTGSGNATFSSTINGAQTLAINSTGATTIGGAIGGITALTSLTTNAGGTVLLNGGSITTTGAQNFGEAATLGAATTLAGGNVTFGNTLDGAFAVTINATGALAFTGNVGASTALTTLTTTSATLAALPEVTAATVNITTTAGSIFLDKITATSSLTIHSFGTIEESGLGDITEDIITPTATLVAGTGIGISGTGLQLELAVASLNATTATGGVDIINTGALSITGGGVTGASGNYNIQTVGGSITLAGAITFAGTSNVTLAPGGASGDLNTGAGITAGSGLITLTAANDVSIGAGNVSTSGNVFITADNDADTFGTVAHAGGIVSASLVNVSAGETITLKTSASFLAATAHDSDITITETNGLALNLVDAGAGDIAITLLAGALTDNNAGAVNIHTSGAGAGATLIAPGGIADIETDVDNLTASSTNSAIIIHEADGLLVNTINAGTGDVTLTATLGALADNNGALTNITGGALTLSAPDGIDLDIAGTTLAATTTNSDITLRELNSLALNLLNAGTGDVTLTAGGAITDANGAANNITAAALTLVGTTGITSIETDVDTLTASTTNADISIAENNSLAVGLVDAGTGNVTLSASGLLTDGNAGSINFAANNLTLNITGGFTSIETDVDSFSATSTNAPIGIIETDDIAIGLVNAGASTVNLISIAGAITDGNAAANNITATTLTLTATTGLDLDITATLLHASVTGTGAINLSDLAGGLDVLDATTANGAITLGAIGGNLSLTGVNAGNGGTLNLSTTSSGNIFLDDATTTGNAIITAIGSISESGAGDADVDLTAGTATFTAGTGIGIGAGGAIETALGTLTAATTTTGGITLDNIGDITIGNATVITSGNITITSATDDTAFPTILPGSITITGHISTPGNVTITAPEFDDAAPPFTNELTIATGATINGAAVTLESGDDLTIAAGATVTSTGLMTLYAGLGDLDDQGDLHIFGTINPGAGLSMTAFGSIGVGTIYAPGQTISITSIGGNIYDQNDTATPTAATVMNITAATLNLNSAVGIGALGNTIETTVSNFNATNGAAGGIYIYNTGALTLGTVTSSGAGAAEDIEITTIGALTLTGSVTQTGGQDITLFATATAAPGLASSLTVNGTLATSGGMGNITLNAANQVNLGTSAIIALASAADLTLNAGWPNAGFSNPNADITISSALNLVDANLTLTASRNVTLQGANADITTTGTFTVDADRDGSANGTGGSFIQDTFGSVVTAATVDITAADIALSGIINAGASNISIHTSRIGSPILLNNAGVGLSISLADMLAFRTLGGDITIGDATNTGITSIGGIGSFGLGLTDSNINIYGGTIDFNGNISLADNRTLTLNSGDIITAAGPGIIDVTIGGTTGTLVINAENNVTLSTLIHNLGATTIISGGTLTLSNNNSALTVSGPVSAETISLTTGTATLTISDTLTASFSNTGNITLIADGLVLNDNITGGGNLLIKGATTATTIGLGDTATGTLTLGVSELAHLIGGFNAINFGYTGQTGAVDIVSPVGNEVIFRDPVTINSSTTLGTIEIEDGPLTATSLGSFTLTSKTLTFSGAAPGIATDSGIIDIHTSMLLAGPTTLTTAIGGGSGNITLDGTIDGAQSLTLDGGATAIVFIKGQATAAPNGTSIGGVTALASLDVTGGVIKLYPNIFTAGTQTYTAPDIRVRSARHISYGDGTGAITFNGDVTLNLLSSYGTTNSAITFNGDIFTEATGKGALTIASGTGSVVFNGDIGTGALPLKSLELLSSGSFTTAATHDLYVSDLLKIVSDEIDFYSGLDSIHVTGAINILPSSSNVGVIVGGSESGVANRLFLSDNDIAAFADGTTSILIGSRAASPDMVIGTTLSFHDPVTFSTPPPRSGVTSTHILVNDDLHGDTANGGFLFRGAGTIFNADVFTTGGTIDIQNGILAAGLVTLDTSAGSGDILFSGTLKPSIGGENLTVLAGAGTIRANGILGRDLITNTVLGDVTLTSSGNVRLEQGFTAESLTVDGTGTTFLKGTFTTKQSGGQEYHAPVQLLGTTSLFSTDPLGAIRFYSTVDSDLTKPTKFFNLNITNRRALNNISTIFLDGALGATGRLGDIKITTTGDTLLAGDVRAKSLAISASDLTVQGVNTTFAQSYLGTSNFIGAITASKLTISTLSGLGITNAAPWNVTGLTALNSKFGDIAITGAANHFGDLILKAPNASLTENGNITLRQAVTLGTLNLVTNAGSIAQTTGSAIAHRFTASATGGITITHIGTRFDEIGTVTAGGPITMVLGGAKYTKLDGTITAATGDIILAKAAASHTSFTASALAHLLATSGRWEVYTTFASSLSQGYNLFTQLAPTDTELGVSYPTPPTSLNNVLLYIYATQP